MTKSLARADEGEVRLALQALVGKTFSDWAHPLFAVFHCGKMIEEVDSRGRQRRYGELSISGDEGWRIIHGSTVILGSDDHRKNSRFYHRKTSPKDELARRRWKCVHDFFVMFDNPSDEKPLPVVTSVELNERYDLTVRLTQGYELFFCGLTSSPDSEVWTLRDRTQSYWCMSDGHFNHFTDKAGPHRKLTAG